MLLELGDQSDPHNGCEWPPRPRMVVVKEGGGMLTNYAGGPPALEGRQLVGSNGQIHEQMQQVLSAGVGSSSESHPAVTTATLNAFLAAFNAHDLDRIMDFLADDCEFHMPRGREPWGTRYVGKPAVREGLATRFTGIPDVHYGEDSHWVAENHGVSTWLLTGTTKTGEQVRVRGVDLLEFRDGKVIKKDAYWKIVEK